MVVVPVKGFTITEINMSPKIQKLFLFSQMKSSYWLYFGHRIFTTDLVYYKKWKIKVDIYLLNQTTTL